ncbi:MAG: NUDIX hydrolase [candidate division Zixibacteria bacterium CG_4_9_14_3_um_filter_46_8]|nr:MAG: NUDIX hydrolase [candidate division Zixibacteria bacterium CG_4_9_14_3_um_filter_46_8]
MYHYKFCPLCSERMVKRIPAEGVDERLVCASCGFIWYNNPVPACGVLITDKDGRVLLARRKYPPKEGDWTLPAGFMESHEGPEECAIRETLEETGLAVKLKGILNAYKGGDDPRTKVVLIIYLAEVVSGKLEPGDDASELGYFDLNELPSNIAFRAHVRAIADYRENHHKPCVH